MEEKLKKYLENNSINYVEHKHQPVFTVEESKKLKSEIPGLHCKCLFLKDNNKKFYLVALPAQKKLDTKKLREELQIKKIKFGSPEELKESLDLIPGSVSIFGMINVKKIPVTLIFDRKVWNAEISGFHPNINTSTLTIKHEDLEKFYNSLNCEKRVLDL